MHLPATKAKTHIMHARDDDLIDERTRDARRDELGHPLPEHQR